MTRVLPPQEVLLALLRYEADSGLLYWRERPLEWFRDAGKTAIHMHASWNTRFAGKRAFTANSAGHHTGAFFGKLYLSHRIIWKMVYGTEPLVIDHINGDGHDNRIDNLRSVTQATNSRNACIKNTSKTGVNGVSFHKQTGKFRANVTVGGKQFHLGLFKTLDEATAARQLAEKEHGFHKNHGRAAA